MVIGYIVLMHGVREKNKSTKLALFLRLQVVQVEWFSIATSKKKDTHVIISFLY